MKRWPLAAVLCLTALVPPYIRVQAIGANGATQVVYRCETSGRIEYTNIPKPGCVVITTLPASKTPVAPNSNAVIDRGTYTNRYGQTVRRPVYIANGQPPAGASAQCRDGSYSFSVHRRGTCSHHGGVAQWVH